MFAVSGDDSRSAHACCHASDGRMQSSLAYLRVCDSNRNGKCSAPDKLSIVPLGCFPQMAGFPWVGDSRTGLWMPPVEPYVPILQTRHWILDEQWCY